MGNFSTMQALNMSPTGIATFAKTHYCEDLRTTTADIAIIGAPFDLAIQGKTGCRLGPRGIRLASTRFSFKPGGNYDPERKTFFLDSNKWKVEDCGDVDYVPGNLEITSNNLKEAVRILRERGALPVVLGGDCSVGFPTMQGLEAEGSFDVIHLDAHLDWTKPMDGQVYFNGSPMRNAAGLKQVGKIVHIGIRGAGSSGPEDYADALNHGDTIYSVKETRKLGIHKILEDIDRGRKIYVAFDIDAMDAVTAAGTAAPMFGGFFYEEMVDILEAVAKHNEVIGMSLTEVAPCFDDNNTTTAYLAARLIADFLGFITKKREERCK